MALQLRGEILFLFFNWLPKHFKDKNRKSVELMKTKDKANNWLDVDTDRNATNI